MKRQPQQEACMHKTEQQEEATDQQRDSTLRQEQAHVETRNSAHMHCYREQSCTIIIAQEALCSTS
jgi:hypothetical protein